MKLGDIKGKRQLQVVGKLMELADNLSEDDAFKSFLEAMRQEESRQNAMFKLGPLLLRDDVSEEIIEIVALGKGVNPEEVDNPVGEIVELLSSDMELPAFLSERQ